MHISIRVCAYIYSHICIYIYAYVRIKMCIITNMHICVSSLVFMSWRIVFLLLEEKLDSTKQLHDSELHEDVSRYAVASVYELDRKHMLININELSFSNGTFMSSGDVFHHLPTLNLSPRLWNVYKINLIPLHRI